VAISGPDEYGRAVLEYRTAFPDLTVTLLTTTWIEIFRICAGKAVEGRLEPDTRRLLDQLS
jgi:hypothetical protein